MELVGNIFAVMVGILLIVAGIFIPVTRRKYKGKTTGTVMGLCRDPNAYKRTGDVGFVEIEQLRRKEILYVIIQYDVDGYTYNQPGSGYDIPSARSRIGKQINVYYKVKEPEMFVTYSVLQSFMLCTLFVFMGMLMILGCFGIKFTI